MRALSLFLASDTRKMAVCLGEERTNVVGGREGRKGNLRKVIDGPNRNTAPMKRCWRRCRRTARDDDQLLMNRLLLRHQLPTVWTCVFR